MTLRSLLVRLASNYLDLWAPLLTFDLQQLLLPVLHSLEKV